MCFKAGFVQSSQQVQALLVVDRLVGLLIYVLDELGGRRSLFVYSCTHFTLPHSQSIENRTPIRLFAPIVHRLPRSKIFSLFNLKLISFVLLSRLRKLSIGKQRSEKSIDLFVTDFLPQLPLIHSDQSQLSKDLPALYQLSVKPVYLDALASIIQHFDWKNIIYLYNSEDGEPYKVLQRRPRMAFEFPASN